MVNIYETSLSVEPSGLRNSIYHGKGLTSTVYVMYLRRQFIFLRGEGLYLVIGLICSIGLINMQRGLTGMSMERDSI